MELIRTSLPWQGLGTNVSTAVTAAEAMQKAGLDYGVAVRRLLTEDKVLVDNFAATVRTDDGSVLGVTSDNYKIVQNIEAFNFADTLAAEHGLVYESAGCLMNGGKTWLTCRLPQNKLLDDDLDMYLVIFNSHDGKGSIRICLTPVRVVCSNMQNLVQRNHLAQFSIYHSSLVSDRLREANETLQNYIMYLSQLNKIAEHLVTVKMDDDKVVDMFDKLYIKKELKQVKQRNLLDIRDTIIEAAKEDNLRNYNGTAWAYVQAVLDVAQHRAPKRSSTTYQARLFTTLTAGQNKLNPLIDALVKS